MDLETIDLILEKCKKSPKQAVVVTVVKKGHWQDLATD